MYFKLYHNCTHHIRYTSVCFCWNMDFCIVAEVRFYNKRCRKKITWLSVLLSQDELSRFSLRQACPSSKPQTFTSRRTAVRSVSIFWQKISILKLTYNSSYLMQIFVWKIVFPLDVVKAISSISSMTIVSLRSVRKHKNFFFSKGRGEIL